MNVMRGIVAALAAATLGCLAQPAVAAPAAAPAGCATGRPAVVGGSVSSVGTSGTVVTITAVINPNGSDTRANIEWGGTRSLGHGTKKTPLGAGCQPISLTATLTGLTQGQAYY